MIKFYIFKEFGAEVGGVFKRGNRTLRAQSIEEAQNMLGMMTEEEEEFRRDMEDFAPFTLETLTPEQVDGFDFHHVEYDLENECTKEELAMKNVMKNAWEIARNGAAKFGGKVKEYFAAALKQAWAEIKANKKAELLISSGSRKHGSKVSKVVNGKAIVVVPVFENWWEKGYELSNGMYEVINAGEVEYISVIDGVIEDAEESEVYGVPVLEGSEKQIAWAKDIRKKFIAKMAQIVAAYEQKLNGQQSAMLDKVKAAYANVLNNKVSASYWIDRRSALAKEIIAENM